MASSQQVRAYLAYWFQLGKPVVFQRRHSRCLPNPIFYHDDYSAEFEDCWQQLEAIGGQDCYLEGTDQTIADLLSPHWEISDCARCVMPVPMAIGPMVNPHTCPCQDLPLWPNSDAPSPRAAVNSNEQLGKIRDRLQSSYDSSAGLPTPGVMDSRLPPKRQLEP
ncbi:MAG: hypothetical protein O2890_02380 [Cyanobacteria bacterium]|nr:hypothetical protein [Cyanobacteriota bacterium]MDA0865263.1 hypothetical protein [Cyanobacteriota bacterium]